MYREGLNKLYTLIKRKWWMQVGARLIDLAIQTLTTSVEDPRSGEIREEAVLEHKIMLNKLRKQGIIRLHDDITESLATLKDVRRGGRAPRRDFGTAGASCPQYFPAGLATADPREAFKVCRKVFHGMVDSLSLRHCVGKGCKG
jgi:hypothetical protein